MNAYQIQFYYQDENHLEDIFLKTLKKELRNYFKVLLIKQSTKEITTKNLSCLSDREDPS